jgi:hypothetical protein
MRRSISTPKYGWNNHNPNIKPDHCFSSRWDELSQMLPCEVDITAVHHYQLFLNFTTVANTPDSLHSYGRVITNIKFPVVRDSVLVHTIDSTNIRVLYCDRNSDSPRLRPINLSRPFSSEMWVTLVFLLTFCAITSSFAISDIQCNWNTFIFIRNIFDSLLELVMCLLEKFVGKTNSAKAFIGLLVICVGNTYKNYLTIELVFPRAGEAISNFTELLDLNFNLLQPVKAKDIRYDKSTWLKFVNFHLEIDETKRGKYVREADRWLKFIPYSDENIINEVASVTSKNAYSINAPYYEQLYALNVITQINYPLSCHFVKRLFAHEFRELYFLNPKAEEFKGWTAKFLDQGLFDF